MMQRSAPSLLIACLAFLCVLAPAAHANTVLTPDTPIVESVNANAFNYYTVSPLVAGKPLTVWVTPFSVDGDPDLLASFTVEHPSEAAGQYDFQSNRFGEDSITIPSHLYADHTEVYFAVKGWRAARYSIVATFGNPIDLQDGVAQSGTVHAGGETFFDFTFDPSSTADVTISCTPSNGLPQVFVSTSEEPRQGDAMWSTVHAGLGALEITNRDVNWPSGSSATFHIGVTGVTSSNFTIVATTEGGVQELVDGMAVSDHLNTRQTEYFKFQVLEEGCTLQITVTPFSGDPDIFVSRYNHHPNRSANGHERMSQQFGADMIEWENAPMAVYYIGVYSFINTSFTVLAKTYCNHDPCTFIELADGVPQSQQLQANHLRYYRLHMDNAAKKVTITLTREYGDPDLYVKDIPESSWPPVAGSCPNPDDPSTYDHVANRFGEDVITLDNPCQGCYLLIGVYAFTNTSFSLTVSKDVITLQDGVPVVDALEENDYDYFQFRADRVGPVTFTVTELGQGDPDLFVSRTHRYPNMVNSTWKAMQIRDDSVTISPTDPDGCSADDVHNGDCVYFLSVHSYFRNSSFTLLAHTGNVSVLQDGVPQYGEVVKEAWNYYRFQAVCPSTAEVTITMSIFQGSAMIYVGTESYPDGTLQSYHWHSEYYGSSRHVTIRPSDLNHCQDERCTYKIGVMARVDTNYTIRGSTDCMCNTLQNGVPYTDHAEPHTWQCYKFGVQDNNLDVSFVVTPITGDPDLFVSAPPPLGHGYRMPNTTHNDGASRNFGGDAVDYDCAVDGSSTPTPAGTYHASVYAFQNTTYTIMAIARPCNSTRCEPVSMFAGQPQVGFVHHGRYQYFEFELAAGHRELTFTLSKIFGDPDMYVDYNKPERCPTMEAADYSSNSFLQDQIVIRTTDYGQVAPGKYRVGVYGYRSSQFVLTASTDCTTLQDGVAVPGSVEQGAYQCYVFPVDNPEVDVNFFVTPTAGDPDLYIGAGERYAPPNTPNITYHQWHATAYRDDAVTISHHDVQHCGHCNYFLSVRGFTTATYNVMASFSRCRVLSPGVPLGNQFALRGTVQCYVFTVPHHGDNVRILVTPRTGVPHIYVGVGYEPTMHNYTYSAHLFQYHLDIPSTDPKACSESSSDERCVYYIGMYAISDTNYTINVQTTNCQPGDPSCGCTTLQDAVPSTDSMAAGEYKYYCFTNTVPNAELDISVTASEGDADLFVTSDPRCNRPSHLSTLCNITQGQNYGEDLVVFPHALQTTYFIGVYGYSNSTYTVMAHVQTVNPAPIDLVDGRGMPGLVGTGLYRNYRIFVPPAQAGGMLVVQVSRRMGDPDLFMNYDLDYDHERVPTSDASDYQSGAYGDDLITVNAARAGVYTIAVYGFSSSIYTLLASIVHGCNPSSLTPGVSYQGMVQVNQYRQYFVRVDHLSEDLTVTVTRLSGDPDLYADRDKCPNRTHHTWSAAQIWDDAITIPKHLLTLGNYYFSVYAYGTNASYSIVASYAPCIELQMGLKQAGSVLTGQTRCYAMYMNVLDESSNRNWDLEINAEGSVYVAVSNTGQEPELDHPSTYQWHAYDFYSVTTLHFDSNNEHFDPNTRVYYIMVKGIGYQGANFTLSPTQANGRCTDVPMQAWVPWHQVGYFYFIVDRYAPIDVTVTPINGDPDLYLSFHNHMPNSSSNSEFVANRFGADSVSIETTNPNYEAPPSTLYIGVKAFTNTSFSIACTYGDNCRNLLNGQSTTSSFDATGDTTLFCFRVESGRHGMQLSVQQDSPWVKVYIRDDGATPTASDWQYKYDAPDGGVVSIPQVCASVPSHHCTVKILAVAAEDGAEVTLTAATSNVCTQLYMGSAVQESLNRDDYACYYMVVGESGSDVTISVTTFSGSPDLYVSMVSRTPNSTDFQWSSSHFEGSSVYIPDASVGTYYIGVVSVASNTSFSILSTSVNDGTRLQRSLPQAGEGYSDQEHLYFFTPGAVPAGTELLIRLDGATVDTYMYVTNNHSRPSPSLYQWSNYDLDQEPSKVTIPADAAQCASCTYFVLLHFTGHVTYSIVWSTSSGTGSATLLSNGRSRKDNVVAGSTNFYQYRVSSTATPVLFELSTYSGAVNMYVKLGDLPSPQNHDFAYVAGGADVCRVSEVERVKIPQPQVAIGQYYVGVQGINTSSFSLVATTTDIWLYDGQPQAFVQDQDGTFFMYKVPACVGTCPAIVVFVEGSQSDDEFEVYITNDQARPVIDRPSAANTANKRTVSSGHEFYVAASDADLWCSNCTLFFGVYPSTPCVAGGGKCRGTVTVSHNRDVVGTLSSNNVYEYSLAKTAKLKFELSVSSLFSLSLEACSGDVHMFAQPRSVPDPDHCSLLDNCWSSTGANHRHVIPQPGQQVPTQEHLWYVTLKGVDNDIEGADAVFHLTPHKDTCYHQPAPLAERLKVTATMQDSGELSVTFNRVAGDSDLTYSVYWDEAPSRWNMDTVCGTRNAKLAVTKLGNQLTSDIVKVVIDGLDANSQYQANVVVSRTSEPSGPFSLYQASSSGKPNVVNPKGGPSYTIWLSVILPLFIVLVVVIIYLCVRNRKLTKELDIEMHDVPRPAIRPTMRGPTGAVHGTSARSGASKKYSRLLTEDDEEEEEEVGTSYVPPDF